MRHAIAALACLTACTPGAPKARAKPRAESGAPSASTSGAPPAARPIPTEPASAGAPDEGARADGGLASAPVALAAVGPEAEAYLFADAPGPDAAAVRARACPPRAPAHERVLCLIDLRYASDAEARAMARELYTAYGILSGVEAAHSEAMGWRGTIHLVPQAPVGKFRTHLSWLLAAARDFERIFGKLDPNGAHPPRYRWRALTIRFMRSVDRTTPSGTAAPDRWEISYNVVGSLNTSEDSVRELFFHELFHRNDSEAGTWSAQVLGPTYRAIVATCRSPSNMACLARYTPTTTTVRGGTYYAFQPADYDPVLEYAAELAVRWYREQRAIVLGKPPGPAFKCGPPENLRAWEAITRDFFGGVDLVPACR